MNKLEEPVLFLLLNQEEAVGHADTSEGSMNQSTIARREFLHSDEMQPLKMSKMFKS